MVNESELKAHLFSPAFLGFVVILPVGNLSLLSDDKAIWWCPCSERAFALWTAASPVLSRSRPVRCCSRPWHGNACCGSGAPRSLC